MFICMLLPWYVCVCVAALPSTRRVAAMEGAKDLDSRLSDHDRGGEARVVAGRAAVCCLSSFMYGVEVT